MTQNRHISCIAPVAGRSFVHRRYGTVELPPLAQAEMADDAEASAEAAAKAERKRKRLEAWRRKQAAQQQQQAATTCSTAGGAGGGTGAPAIGARALAVAAAVAAAPVPVSAVSAARQRPAPATAPEPAAAFPAALSAPPSKKKVTVSLGLGFAGKKKKKKKKKNMSKKNKNKLKSKPALLLDADDGGDDDAGESNAAGEEKKEADPGLLWDPTSSNTAASSNTASSASGGKMDPLPGDSNHGNNHGTGEEEQEPPKKRSRRWDAGHGAAAGTAAGAGAGMDASAVDVGGMDDALDKFMDQLEAGATGQVTALDIDVGGSMQRASNGGKVRTRTNGNTAVEAVVGGSGGVITAAELERLRGMGGKRKHAVEGDSESDAGGGGAGGGAGGGQPLFTHSDWESDAPNKHADESASEAETDNEEEEKARRAFLEALKKSAPMSSTSSEAASAAEHNKPQIKSEVLSEKHRREEHIRQLEAEATAARRRAQKQEEFGRMYNDAEDGVMEEAERTLDVLTAAPDALEVLAELNKKKELKAVDHGKIDYLSIRKNLFVVPRSLANLSENAVEERRAEMHIRVRGRGAPAPVATFRECGLSERILAVLESQSIDKPFPVQAQCMPCIMAGRDVIGIAKTGSGKTLAYLLPMLRHITDQPPLQPGESGPIGLCLAPARELAFQIHNVCKVFAKNLGLKSTAVYGGAGVAEQIGDLKRGTHIVVATPGRMIDILTMQSGKILSLQRVSYVVMDEADRLFDMGFGPQISAILSAIRPDRQTVLFSATFPKSVETLARKSLKYPIEVLIGGRSVASDTITQHGEVIEEEEKFLRLLQILGEHVTDEEKVIVFVDTQVRADNLFEQLIRCGYSSLSLHGGKEQEDRDSTISDFKDSAGPNILVATSVAGRGLDVPSCRCVVNYSAPNHLEDYVHRVGRTGRAGSKGEAYTFVNSVDEAKFAPSVVRAMIEAGQSKNISQELRDLSESFKEKVKKGEAKRAGSGFKGKGYTYDSSELSEAQKLARLEKRQALIEAGMIDEDDEAGGIDTKADQDGAVEGDDTKVGGTLAAKDQALQATKLSAELLALPGMHDMVMKKAGFGDGGTASGEPDSASGIKKTSDNHFVAEIEINDYPQPARWKVTQKETTSRLQDDFQTAVTLKGQYFGPNRDPPAEGERKLYLHLEAVSEHILKNGMHEIRRLLNEETLRVGAKGIGGGSSGHKYSVL